MAQQSHQTVSYGATASEVSLGENESLVDYREEDDGLLDEGGEGSGNGIGNGASGSSSGTAQKQIDFVGDGGSSGGSIEQLAKAQPCLTITVILVLILSTVLIVLATSTSIFDSYARSRLDDDDDADATPVLSDSISFTFYRNGYDVLDQFLPGTSAVLKYRFLDTYDGIVEPYGEMHLQPLSFANYTSYDYKFTICEDAESSKSTACKHGDLWADGTETPFSVACDTYDTYKVQVTEYYPDSFSGTETVDGLTLTDLAGRLRRTADGALMCMYVRRELRVLTEADLNDTMNAMAVLWSTDDEHGNSQYGDNYHSASYFVQAHEFNSAQQDADHMHEVSAGERGDGEMGEWGNGEMGG